MTVISIPVPDKMQLDKIDTVRFLAAKLYESGRVTLGQAAELAGMSKAAFMEIVGDYGVAIFNYPVSEMVTDAAKL